MNSCVVCGAVSQQTRCHAHRHWKRVSCSTCGTKTYNANAPKPGRNVYCSPACRQPVSRTTALKPCAHCGTPMHRKRGSRRKYCDDCVMAKVWPLVSQPRTSTRRYPCTLCGVIRMTTRGTTPERYVCHPCRRSNEPHRAAIRAKQAKSRADRSGDHRKRARSFGVEYEPVNKRRVFDRDRWMCGICGLKVDRRLTHPDPMVASLDHVVPMSKGGGHTYANTQCSHLICNVRKGAHGIAGEQLALIG